MYGSLSRSRLRVELGTLLLLRVKNYLNNYFDIMYSPLTRFLIRLELASPAYLVLIITINIYLPLYGHLPRSRLRVDFAPTAYMWLRTFVRNFKNVEKF